MLVSRDATGTETISMASEAMSLDDGCDSEFDFGDMESGGKSSLGGRRNSAAKLDKGNILV